MRNVVIGCAVVLQLASGLPLSAQIRSTPLTLPLRRPVTQAASAGAASGAADAGQTNSAQSARPALRDEEIAVLTADYQRLSPEDREAMVATYRDLGIDLLAALGLATGDAAATGTAQQGGKASLLLKAVRKLSFARTPDLVLEARAKIGLRAVPLPAADAPIDDQANWLHQNVLAGEWTALQSFLKERAGGEAAEMYAHVLQSTNQGDPGLLPEEILAISEACPSDLNEWQLTLLAQLLKNAAARSSTGPFLDQLRAGTTFFGPQEDGRRDRTAKFLSDAMLVVEAYDYLPVLENAREKRNTEALVAHARYHEARAVALGAAPAAEQQRRTAWELYCEVVMLETADPTQRREAMGQAIELLPHIPPGPATHWLQSVFARPSLAAAGLEAVALKAMRIGNEKLSMQERASAILMMKDSVDALLNDEDVELAQLRVPLRLLTMSLVTAAEETISKQAGKTGVAAETALLLRALPGERWRSLIEPSLAVRAWKAFVGIALAADSTDLALELLAKAIAQTPKQSMELADEFLRVWLLRLNPAPDPQRMNQFIVIGGRSQRAAAPLTRGRQTRNLERLQQLLDLLDGIGANGRSLERVVQAFAACHGKAETFRRDRVVSVLGPIEQLAPAVSARLAEAMRSGLNGDWRSRDVQRDQGNQRSDSEIEALIEEGYSLALELIDSAQLQDAESWRYAMTKAALSYDHMQFRRQREQDAASYNAARQDLFRAFGAAARQYQAAVIRGDLRQDPGVYLTWFGISLGSSDLSGLSAEDLLSEGAENTEQMELIRRQILEMPDEMAASHLGEFSRRVIDQLPRLTPEVKPGVVQRACAIVGDHPAGALLRQTQELYQDLLRDEIHLHLTVDGPDHVGTSAFGAVLTLRYSAAIGRELGGFSQYLQNNVYTYVAGKYQAVSFRDRLEKSIRQAFSGDIELVHLGFFDSMNPSRPVQAEGQSGWEEKPLCYLVLRANDPSIDRLPTLQLDVNTMDDSGMVVLPVHSNSVVIDATPLPVNQQRTGRPVFGLHAVETIDTRDVSAGTGTDIRFEVTATGRGVIPELTTLLPGFENAIPGYVMRQEAVEEEGIRVLGVEATDSNLRTSAAPDESETYVDADEDGVFRLMTTRKWSLVFAPRGMAQGNAIQVPRLNSELQGTLAVERYREMDLIPVDSLIVPVRDSREWPFLWLLLATMIAAALGIVVWQRMAQKDGASTAVEAGLRLPAEITPFTAVMTLRRFSKDYAGRLNPEQSVSLQADISALEQTFFGADTTADPDLAANAVRRWFDVLGGTSVAADRSAPAPA